MCSRDLNALFIGTAPDEWLEGLTALEPVMRASTEASIRLPNGAAITLRATTVCHQEGGQWRAVHTHQSIGVPDDLVMNVAK